MTRKELAVLYFNVLSQNLLRGTKKKYEKYFEAGAWLQKLKRP
jgi:hypothetical protein